MAKPRVGKKKLSILDARRANDPSSAVRGMRKIVKGGIVKWVPIKKK